MYLRTPYPPYCKRRMFVRFRQCCSGVGCLCPVNSFLLSLAQLTAAVDKDNHRHP